MIRLAVLVYHVRADQARGAMDGGRDRNDNLPDAKLGGVSARMHWPGAPEGEEHKISRVVPFLYGRLSDQVAHVRVRDPIDAARRFDVLHAQRLCDLVANGI